MYNSLLRVIEAVRTQCSALHAELDPAQRRPQPDGRGARVCLRVHTCVSPFALSVHVEPHSRGRPTDIGSNRYLKLREVREHEAVLTPLAADGEQRATHRRPTPSVCGRRCGNSIIDSKQLRRRRAPEPESSIRRLHRRSRAVPSPTCRVVRVYLRRALT